LSHQI